LGLTKPSLACANASATDSNTWVSALLHFKGIMSNLVWLLTHTSHEDALCSLGILKEMSAYLMQHRLLFSWLEIGE
jgi:predicted nucleic acid-binding protein